jgi:hypothetical protein
LTFDKMDPAFVNPHTGGTVNVIFDAVKLIRNNLAKQEYFLRGDSKIEWRYYAMLESLQTLEKLHLATKITPRHIDINNEKMKAKLALQIFSESTACALEYLETIATPGFEDVKETINFTRGINDEFDI